MKKVCIILNSSTQVVEKQLVRIYENQTDTACYSIELKEGFSSKFEPDTTEILFGGGEAIHLKNHPELKEEVFDFIRGTALPMFGICFGAQLLARAHGARLVKLPDSSKGLASIRILKDTKKYNGQYIGHVYKNQDWSLQELPDEFVVAACSDDGIEMFYHRSLPIAGVQFHPEQFSKTNDGLAFFHSLRSLILER